MIIRGSEDREGDFDCFSRLEEQNYQSLVSEDLIFLMKEMNFRSEVEVELLK